MTWLAKESSSARLVVCSPNGKIWVSNLFKGLGFFLFQYLQINLASDVYLSTALECWERENIWQEVMTYESNTANFVCHDNQASLFSFDRFTQPISTCYQQLNLRQRYRTDGTRWSVNMKEKISQAVSDKFIILKTVILKNVWVGSNDQIRT